MGNFGFSGRDAFFGGLNDIKRSDFLYLLFAFSFALMQKKQKIKENPIGPHVFPNQRGISHLTHLKEEMVISSCDPRGDIVPGLLIKRIRLLRRKCHCWIL
jgi:hypothetical protein